MTDLVRVTYGVWRDPRVVADLPGRVAAQLTACPPGTVVCGFSAARLHGLWLPDVSHGSLEVIVHPDVVVPADRSGNSRPDICARRRILAPDEVTWLDGIAVTTEARTWFDLAGRLSIADLVACGDSVLRGAATQSELAEIIRRAFHRPGVRKARAALPYLDARSRSRPESHLRYAIVSAGLPEPAVNEPIFDELGQWLAEPDLSYARARLALEYNGADHGGVPRMRKDITRGFTLSEADWRTEVFGPAQVFGRPDQVAALVRRLLDERTRTSTEWDKKS